MGNLVPKAAAMLARAQRADDDCHPSASGNKHATALEARSDLAKEIRQALVDTTSSRSCYSMLKKRLETATTEQIEALERNPKDFVAKHKREVIKPLTDMGKVAAKMRLREVDAKKA